MAEEGMPALAAGWSVEEVAAWVLTLEGIDDVEALAVKVRTEEVDGFAMMAYKDRLEVRSELSLSGGKAARLFAAIWPIFAATSPLTHPCKSIKKRSIARTRILKF